MIYRYRIHEISFDSEGETLLGIEVVETGQVIYRSAYPLFFQEDWFTQFSPNDIRAIACFAFEDRWKRDLKSIMHLKKKGVAPARCRGSTATG